MPKPADALASLHGNPERLKEMGREAREKFANAMTRLVGEAVHECYRSCLQR